MELDKRDLRASRRRVTTKLALIQNRLRRLSSGFSDKGLAPELSGLLGLNLLHEPSEPRVDFVFVRDPRPVGIH